MSDSIYALIDCNNFYASCERIFDPSLCDKSIAILSNDDGFIISPFSRGKEVGANKADYKNCMNLGPNIKNSRHAHGHFTTIFDAGNPI